MANKKKDENVGQEKSKEVTKQMNKGMSRKMMKAAAVQDTLVGAYTNIVGDLISEKSIRIDGKITGNITSVSKVLVGEKGMVEGNIEAEVIVIYGMVKGNVKATSVLEIMESGKLHGDAKMKKIIIHEDAIFAGVSLMEG